VPPELAAMKRTQNAVLMMMSSHRIVYRKSLRPAFQVMMAPYEEELWPLFYEIFIDNSRKQRVQFFSDPLVQFLWAKFKIGAHRKIREYL